VPLLKRIAGEHRRVVLTVGIAFVLNVIAYVAVVMPLSSRVANIEQRNQAAEQELASARREHAEASGTLTGKDRAAKELETFYTSVLPRDLTGARRLTHPRLQVLARQSNLDYGRSSVAAENERDSDLTRLKISMDLEGSYANMRTFIHQLENAPEFVVIDDLELTEGAEGSGSIEVRLELSTYFRNVTPQ
jgi:Tfp pilus assembly protein PilO